jgi:hypothetical protein
LGRQGLLESRHQTTTGKHLCREHCVVVAPTVSKITNKIQMAMYLPGGDVGDLGLKERSFMMFPNATRRHQLNLQSALTDLDGLRVGRLRVEKTPGTSMLLDLG